MAKLAHKRAARATRKRSIPARGASPGPSPWTYLPWPSSQTERRPVEADKVLLSAPGHHQFTVEGAVLYAEQSYLACRLLLLCNRALTLEALCCAGQTLEKYMK